MPARNAGLLQQQRAFEQYAVDMRRLRQSIEKAFHRIKLKHLIERDALCLRLIAKPCENEGTIFFVDAVKREPSEKAAELARRAAVWRSEGDLYPIPFCALGRGVEPRERYRDRAYFGI